MDESTPIRGITRTSDSEPPVRAAVAAQSLSLVLFIAGLLPPIILILLRALSGASHTIPYAALWAWGSFALAIVLVVRAALAFATSTRANALTAFTGPALLLAVAIVVFVMRMHLTPTPLPLAIAQIVLYCVCAFSLLLAPTQV